MITADDSRPGLSALSAGSSRVGRERDVVPCDDVSLVRARSQTSRDAAQLCEAQALIDAFDGRDASTLLSEVRRLTGVLVSRGATARAGVLLRQALTIADQHLDRDNAELARVLHELAHVFVREGRYADAEPLLLRLYYIQCRTRGRDHPDTASVMASLARVRQALGRHDDAEAMWRHVIAVCERSLGPQHVATTAAMERLAESCAARGKHAEAGQLRALATAIRETPASAVSPPIVAPSDGPSTRDALLAIQAELLSDSHSRRRWPAYAAAAAVIIALGVLTSRPGAARAFALRPVKTAPTWEVWTPPAPMMADSTPTVRRVIPDMRSEPARRAAAEARPERDEVEMAFPVRR